MHSVFSIQENPVNVTNGLKNSNVAFGLGGTGSAEFYGMDNIFDNFDTAKSQINPLDLPGSQAALDAFVSQYKNGGLSARLDVNIPLLYKTTEHGSFAVEVGRVSGVSGSTFGYSHDDGNPTDVDAYLGIDTALTSKDEIAVSYARHMRLGSTDDLKLNYGMKARGMNIGANKYVFDFDGLVNLNAASQDEFEDVVDALDSSMNYETHFTADLGFSLNASNWTTSLSVKNLIPVNVDYQITHSDALDSKLGNSFDRSFTVGTYGVISGALHTQDNNWTLSAYAETNAHQNLLNMEEQNIGANASFATDTSWIPDVRFGLNNNLAGTEFTTYAFGLTLGVLNLDVSASQLSYDSDKQEEFAGAASLSLEFEI